MLRENAHATRPNIGARFALGETFITPGAQEALDIAGESVRFNFYGGTCRPIGAKFLRTMRRRMSFR